MLKCVEIGQIGTPKPKSRSNSTEAQLVREVNALLKLRHANLVPYYKVFVQDRRLCTMAGFCSLGSFHDLFEAIKSGLEWASEFCVSSDTKEKAIAPRLVWHFLIQVLEGLEQLHKCSIIHRFIKPRNLLLEPETTFTHPDFKWRVRIADVAVPEMLRRDAKLRPQKVRYLAPELISGNSPFDVKVRDRMVPTGIGLPNVGERSYLPLSARGRAHGHRQPWYSSSLMPPPVEPVLALSP